MQIVVKVTGVGKIVYGKKELRALLGKAGREVAATARQLVAKKFTKAQIAKGMKRGAAAAGQPPLSRSGVLRAGIKATVSRSGEAVRIQDKVPYALFLEAGVFGGGGKKGSGRGRVHRERGHPRAAPPSSRRVMTPHPFISTALDMRRGDIEQRIKAAVDHGLAWKRTR